MGSLKGPLGMAQKGPLAVLGWRRSPRAERYKSDLQKSPQNIQVGGLRSDLEGQNQGNVFLLRALAKQEQWEGACFGGILLFILSPG